MEKKEEMRSRKISQIDRNQTNGKRLRRSKKKKKK